MVWRAQRERRRRDEVLPDRVWGMPSACPDCGGNGYLDRIDLVQEVMHQHCTACGLRWDTAKDETTIIGS